MEKHRPRLSISFSGGRSSAVMSELCLEKYSQSHQIMSIFMNTGCEDERTLEFVRDCNTHIFKGQLIWLEAVINGPRKGPTAKVVDFNMASRNGEPFEAAIKKHGVFCKTHPQCTSRLKTEPMTWFRRICGWLPGTYDTAIGIRSDEIDRCSASAAKKRIIYPLVEAGYDKAKVNMIMATRSWDLKLPSEAYGNCVWCWKKSRRKLLTVAKANPEAFEFPDRMEKLYGHIDRGTTGASEPRKFFRGRESAADIVHAAATTEFEPHVDTVYGDLWPVGFDPEMDSDSGCGDSCEVGADEE